jgi:hypothetical protein
VQSECQHAKLVQIMVGKPREKENVNMLNSSLYCLHTNNGGNSGVWIPKISLPVFVHYVVFRVSCLDN